MVAHDRTGAATAAMREQRHVGAGFQGLDAGVDCEQSELDEVIAAAAGAELGPGFVFVLFGDRADGPVGIQDGVGAAILEGSANAEAGFGGDGAGEAILLVLEVADGEIEHCHFHAAGDVHADGVRDDDVIGGEHAADGQAVADVGVGHQSAGHGHGEEAGFLHLHDGLGLQASAPLAVFDGFGARGRRGFEQGAGEFAAQGVGDKGGGVGDDGGDLVGEARFVAAAEDILGDEISGAPGGFTQRDAEAEEVFGVHGDAISNG